MNGSEGCLTPELLRQVSKNELSPREIEELEEHVTQCAGCRRTLEQATAETDWGHEVRDSLADKSGPTGWSAFAVSAANELPDDGCGAIDQFRKLLGPTDDPRMLGRIGTYEIIGIVGRGGMGVVFKAFDGALNRYVAIKMLLPHLATSAGVRKRFAREAQAAAAVVHDHVMAIHSVAEWQGVPYLVMPFGRGVSLQKRLNDQGSLEVREILRIGMQTAAGLAAAHAQGLVHRDVKPANILLAEDVERVTLTDFGLARAVDDLSLTRIGVLAGTPQYMSPEQARGKAVDARSDLFSFGSVLYVMCTGRSAFQADSSYGVLRLITDDEPTPVREINPEIPQWLCAIVAKLMSKRPSDRFESAAEVAELLEKCLAHVQQPAAVPLPASLIRQTTSRRWIFKLGVIALFGVVGFTLVGIFAWRASDAPPQSDAKDIQGTWQVIAMEVGGVQPEGQYKDLNMRFVFDDHSLFQLQTHPADGREIRTPVDTFILNDKVSPKTIDLSRDGRTVLGTYSLERNNLQLRIAEEGENRPSGFIKNGSTEKFYVLKRVGLHPTSGTSRDAEKLLAWALEQAKAGNKRVLLVAGKSRQLDELFAEIKPILDKYLVLATIDFTEMEDGHEVEQRFRQQDIEKEHGFAPWMIILSDTAQPLAQSGKLIIGKPDSVLGLPQGSDADRRYFLNMLRTSCPDITDDELTRIDRAAKSLRDRIRNDIRGRGRGRVGGVASIAGIEVVQTDLGVNADKKTKIADIVAKYHAELQDQMGALQGGRTLSPEEGEKQVEAVAQILRDLNGKYAAQLRAALSAEQFTRLQQINWQAQGAMVLQDPEVVKELAITKEQQVTIVKPYYQEMIRALRGVGGFEAIQEAAQQRDQLATDALTKEQRDKLAKLKGKEFDFTQLRGRGRGIKANDPRGL